METHFYSVQMAFVVIRFQFFFLRNILDSTMSEWRTSCWWTACLPRISRWHLFTPLWLWLLWHSAGTYRSLHGTQSAECNYTGTVEHNQSFVCRSEDVEELRVIICNARTLQKCNYGIPSRISYCSPRADNRLDDNDEDSAIHAFWASPCPTTKSPTPLKYFLLLHLITSNSVV